MPPYLIEQTQEQLQKAIRFFSKSSIRAIRLVDCGVRSSPQTGASKTAYKLDAKPAGYRKESNSVFIATLLDFKAVQSESEHELLYSIDCKFETEYEISVDVAVDQDEIEAFQ